MPIDGAEDPAIAALRVHQWLPAWDELAFDPDQRQSKPNENFYLFSMPASKLRRLAGIYRRSTADAMARKDDLGIQRRHDSSRSTEIRHYVQGGFPWSALSDAKRKDGENDALKKPGWLPTAVVINILGVGDERDGVRAAEDAVIDVQDVAGEQFVRLVLPKAGSTNSPPPIEVIDGQHRLFAFDDENAESDDYELPVVAFHQLDISWQAYLFWTINIKPKRINASLAFDLYPLLREQDWLDSGEVVQVYRESRAQELAEMLWSVPDNPWYQRINMLGGSRRENGPVTQAAFIRSLVASLVKSWEPRGALPGGLFGGTTDGRDGLSWSRTQQSAFLLTAWSTFAEQVKQSHADWAEALREADAELEIGVRPDVYREPAFTSSNSLLATDQGVRAFQYVINDLCQVKNRELRLQAWNDPGESSDVTPELVRAVADSLRAQPVYEFLVDISKALAQFDWRTSGAPGLDEQARRAAAALRGSGGYRELRMRLIGFLQESDISSVQLAASLVRFQ